MTNRAQYVAYANNARRVSRARCCYARGGPPPPCAEREGELSTGAFVETNRDPDPDLLLFGGFENGINSKMFQLDIIVKESAINITTLKQYVYNRWVSEDGGSAGGPRAGISFSIDLLLGPYGVSADEDLDITEWPHAGTATGETVADVASTLWVEPDSASIDDGLLLDANSQHGLLIALKSGWTPGNPSHNNPPTQALGWQDESFNPTEFPVAVETNNADLILTSICQRNLDNAPADVQGDEPAQEWGTLYDRDRVWAGALTYTVICN